MNDDEMTKRLQNIMQQIYEAVGKPSIISDLEAHFHGDGQDDELMVVLTAKQVKENLKSYRQLMFFAIGQLLNYQDVCNYILEVDATALTRALLKWSVDIESGDLDPDEAVDALKERCEVLQKQQEVKEEFYSGGLLNFSDWYESVKDTDDEDLN